MTGDSSGRNRGRTPLRRLAIGGERGAAAIDLLLGAGADKNARADDGGTPLDSALAVEAEEISDLLRGRGAVRRDQVEGARTRREGR